jgi:hypothetical protein
MTLPLAPAVHGGRRANAVALVAALAAFVVIAVGFAHLHYARSGSWETAVGEGAELASMDSAQDLGAGLTRPISTFAHAHRAWWDTIVMCAIVVDATLFVYFAWSWVCDLQHAVSVLLAAALALLLSVGTAFPPPAAGDLCTPVIYHTGAYIDVASAMRTAILANFLLRAPVPFGSMRFIAIALYWFATTATLASGCAYTAAVVSGAALGAVVALHRARGMRASDAEPASAAEA